MGFEVMSDQEVQVLADLIKEYPEAAWAAVICGTVAFLTINFAWWLIELPQLVNAHSDSLLLAAFAGSLGLVLFDAVAVVWAFRCANRISAAIRTTRNNNDDEA
jgi:hypothetical protein